MAALKTIRFNLKAVRSDEFALLAESYDLAIPVTVNVGIAFSFAKEENTIGALVKCTFLQEQKVLIVVAASCWFKIDAEDWKSIYDPTERLFTLSRPHALHFASLTIGTTRGVLHVKTEGHALNSIVLPPVNANDILKEDVKATEPIVQG